jgi:hypothetical protein
VFVQLNNRDTIRIGEPGYSEDGDHPMIVIERDGKTIVITGWRAWVIGAVAVVVMTAVLAALAFLVFGIALRSRRSVVRPRCSRLSIFPTSALRRPAKS